MILRAMVLNLWENKLAINWGYPGRRAVGTETNCVDPLTGLWIQFYFHPELGCIHAMTGDFGWHLWIWMAMQFIQDDRHTIRRCGEGTNSRNVMKSFNETEWTPETLLIPLARGPWKNIGYIYDCKLIMRYTVLRNIIQSPHFINWNIKCWDAYFNCIYWDAYV